MYLSFYEFTQKPFQDTTHPNFFWLGETHREALAIFKDGILTTPGILLLTGDIGTGKTILSNELIRSLGDQVVVAKIPDPGLEVVDFLCCIADAFDMNRTFGTEDAFYVQFGHLLNNAVKTGKKLLLIIDECQRLRTDLLVEIRKLANSDKLETKVLNILLIGQNELKDVLQNHDGGALHQCIHICYALPPLDLHETGELILHRLKIADAKENIFTPDAISEIYQFSAGIPRKINNICDHALLSGFIKGTRTVTGEIVRECAKYFNPPDIPKIANTEPAESVAHSDSTTIDEIPSASIKKIDPLRVWTTVGTIILVTIGVFVVTYIIYPREYESLFYRAKNSGIPILNHLGKTTPAKIKSNSGPQPEPGSNSEPAPISRIEHSDKSSTQLSDSPVKSTLTRAPDTHQPIKKIGGEDEPASPQVSSPFSAQQDTTTEGDLKNDIVPRQAIQSSKSLVVKPEDNRITDGIDSGASEITEKDAIDARDKNNDFKAYSKLKEQMIQKIRNNQSPESSE